MVGLLGNLRFRVSDNRVLTFRNFKREIAGNWSTTDRINQKPLPEFGGAQLQTITLEITLDASLGIKPRKLLKTIENMVETGEVHELAIGKKIVGKNKWVITKSSEAWDTILSGGELLRAKVSLTLQEYI